MALMIISSALCWSARCPTLALTCTLTPTLTRTATLTLARSCLLYWPTNYQQFAVLLPCCTFYWGWASNHVDSTPDVPGGRGPSGCLAEGRGRGRGRVGLGCLCAETKNKVARASASLLSGGLSQRRA
jgi:hypothetical protein